MEMQSRAVEADVELQIEVKAPAAARWLNETISAMVDEEIEVDIETTVTPSQTIFAVRVAEGDIGKVIGKQGRTARSLRTLLNCRAKKDGAVYVLDIAEDDVQPLDPRVAKMLRDINQPLNGLGPKDEDAGDGAAL